MPTDHDSTDFDLQSVEISEVFEGVKAVLLAPVLLPLASAVNQPLVKAVIRESIAFSERCQDAVADAQERLDDILAEAQAEAHAEAEARRRSPHTSMKRADTNGGDKNKAEPSSHDSPENESSEHQASESSPSNQAILVRRESGAYPRSSEVTQTALQVGGTVEEINAQLRWLTNDTLDLRILTTTALGAFALRQIFVRGLRLDEIPWYVAAWYALDTFVKFHPDVIDTGVSPRSPNPAQNPASQTIDMELSP